jgi:hypothetical protein
MYLRSIKSVKHKAAKSVNRSILKKSQHLGFGVFMVHSSMRNTLKYNYITALDLNMNPGSLDEYGGERLHHRRRGYRVPRVCQKEAYGRHCGAVAAHVANKDDNWCSVYEIYRENAILSKHQRLLIRNFSNFIFI